MKLYKGIIKPIIKNIVLTLFFILPIWLLVEGVISLSGADLAGDEPFELLIGTFGLFIFIYFLIVIPILFGSFLYQLLMSIIFHYTSDSIYNILSFILTLLIPISLVFRSDSILLGISELSEYMYSIFIVLILHAFIYIRYKKSLLLQPHIDPQRL